MNRIVLKKTSLFTALVLLVLLLTQFVRQLSANNHPAMEALSPEKVNLALRRTAHHLLSELGDTTSRIPPVQQTAQNVWLIRLEHTFNYDRLPTLLQSSFELHGIKDNYDVAVLRCNDGELQLGYNYLDFLQYQEVPCGGREISAGCYNLQVTFPALAKKEAIFPLWSWMLFFGSAAGLLFWVFYQKKRPKPNTEEQSPVPVATEGLRFGQCCLDVANQVLTCGTTRYQLTYREAKLLHLFASRPNQLLERDFILQNVWADEGILVSRSVDVFVSRLRKMLRTDPSVEITAVHGVGYRLMERE